MALSVESETKEEIGELGANEEIEIKPSELLKVEINIKDEPPFEEAAVHEMLMDEIPENKHIQIKDNPERRRSLRNEQASGKKIKPAKYDEIFNCYKRKEYKECIIYIDLVAEITKDCLEYQILKVV
jgi:hypothetical protein